MKVKRRSWLSIIIVALLVLASSACAPSPKYEAIAIAEKANPVEKMKLRFISSWGGVDAKADPLQQILNRFMEEHPDIEVVNESMFGDDFLHKLKTDFASGYNPDVFGLWPGSDIRALIKADKVADLTEVLEKEKAWKETFGKDNWEYTTFNGKIYGLPLEIIYECLFINRDLFAKYNVKVPRTYNDLKQAVIDFKNNNITPIAYNSTPEGTYLYQNIIAKLGGKANVELPFKNGKANRCYTDAMEVMKELYNMGAFPENYFKLSSRDRDALFMNKRAAMIVQGSWFLGRFDNEDTTVDIVPFPSFSGGVAGESSLIYGFGCGTFYMSKTTWDNSDRREASIKLLKALTSEASADLLSEKTGMISNVRSKYSNTYLGRLRVTERALLNNAVEFIRPPDSFVDRSVWEGTIVKEFPYVLEGERSAESLWDAAKMEYVKKGIE
ncbi:MAG: extracellular solute-binding protein [Clostridia bacterium]|nr:extracellular solute-binding protein [Clostridia bacterium]